MTLNSELDVLSKE